MERVGYFVVGDGKFGEYLFDKGNVDNRSGRQVHSPHYFQEKKDIQYWENRGYKAIPVYVGEEDYDDYKVSVTEDE